MLTMRKVFGANDIFRQARFRACFPVNDAAGNAERFRDHLFLGQFVKRGQAPRTRDHLVFVALGFDHNEVVKEAVSLNRSG